MDKKRLKALKALIKEAEHLEGEYQDIICVPKELVSDSYKDYRHGHEQVKTLTGYGDPKYTELREKMHAKRLRIVAEISEIEDWMNGVEDAEIRDILRQLYVYGKTQAEIADELGYTRSAIAMKIKAFWDQL